MTLHVLSARHAALHSSNVTSVMVVNCPSGLGAAPVEETTAQVSVGDCTHLFATLNPALQVGVHVTPDARDALQSPTRPFAGATLASQASGSQVASVSSPTRQLVVPDAVNPESHSGTHVVPDARVAVQSPT